MPILNDESCVIKVHLANSSYNNVRFNEYTNVEVSKIIKRCVINFFGSHSHIFLRKSSALW